MAHTHHYTQTKFIMKVSFLRLVISTWIIARPFSSNSTPPLANAIKIVANYSCNVFADTCPTQYNQVCDRKTNPLCANGDCSDCDQCEQFATDCMGCLSHGCYWCPGDATCFNSPEYIFNKISACNVSQYSQTTCNYPNPYFRYDCSCMLFLFLFLSLYT